MICRIISHSESDAKMNEAFEEAVLLARHDEQGIDTIRVWQNERAVILSNNADIRLSVDENRCRLNNVAIVRRASSGKTMYQDRGTLNLTYFIKQSNFFSDTNNLTEIYKRLCQPVAQGISTLGAEAKVDDYGQGIIANGKRLSDASVNFYYDLVLFGLSLNINTDLEILRQVLKQEDEVTTLTKVLGRTVSVESALEEVLNAITQHFKLTIEKQDFSASEKQLAKTLYNLKYSRDEWTVDRNAPLSLREVLVDLYVAYPPTRNCREIIGNVESAIADIKDKVELRIWMHGKGLNGQGCPPGVAMPKGLTKAAKESTIPAVIINGEIVFSRVVPSKEDLRRRILQGIKR